MIYNCKFCLKNFTSKIRKNRNIYCSLDCKRKGIFKWINTSFIDSFKRLESFFDKKAIKKNGCWDWSGCFDRNNYGYMSFLKKRLYAHRASWIIYNGFIPDGQCVLHRCDNPRCTNPEHLFLGTQRDNLLDMINKKRYKLMPSRKFNKEDVLNIRKLLNDGKSQRTIAALYNVSHSIIGDIKLNKSYQDF